MATVKAATRKRVNIINDVTWELCKALPNVKWEAPANADAETHPGLNEAMRVILFNAAYAQPTWTFNLDAIVGGNGAWFNIKCGTEPLGSVKYEYSRRTGKYMPHLHADRLPWTRTRSNTFSHKEPAAVLRKLREFVYPKTLAEKVTGPLNDAISGIYGVERACDNAVSEARRRMQNAAIEFALSPRGKEAFMAYEADVGTTKGRKTVEDIEALRVEAANAKMAEDMRVKAGKEYPIAIRKADGWYVKHNEVVSLYPEDELPPEYVNVHILKMSADAKVLENIGIKLSETSYVVVAVMTTAA